MKIYFDGCSFTAGEHYLSDFKEQRYSARVAKHFGAEEHNFAKGGAGNPTILRHFTYDHYDSLETYDLIVIQFTFRNRTSYYDKDNSKWQNVNVGDLPFMFGHQCSESKSKFWNSYYKDIYTEEYGRYFEQMCFRSITDICKSKSLPLVTLNSSTDSNFDTDIVINQKYAYGSHLDSGKHPNRTGHYQISKDVIQIVESML